MEFRGNRPVATTTTTNKQRVEFSDDMGLARPIRRWSIRVVVVEVV